MTNAEILAMQPGPELDDALALRLFQTVKMAPGLHFSWQVDPMAWREVPSPSTTWEGMRLVVEAMAARGWTLHLTARADWNTAAFRHPNLPDWTHWVEDKETAPHAVGIAALLALESHHAR